MIGGWVLEGWQIVVEIDVLNYGFFMERLEIWKLIFYLFNEFLGF